MGGVSYLISWLGGFGVAYKHSYTLANANCTH